MVDWKWTHKDRRSVAHDKNGVARAVIYRDAPRSYSVQRAVEWPGGTRDWLTKATGVGSRADAIIIAERS